MTEIILTPTLYCPFPSAVSDRAETVQQHTIEWVRRFNLLTGEAAGKSLSAAKFGVLVARSYPNAPLEELQIISDWIGFFLILDDLSERDMGKQTDKLAALYASLLDILKGRDVAAKEEPALAHALQDIRERLLQKAPPGWMLHFIPRVEECWNSWVWEATNRAKDMTPDVATYTKMRPLTVAFYPLFALIEIAEEITLPAKVREHSAVRELELRASREVGWANYIISLKKELAEGESHNLVLLLHSQEGLPLQKAVERVAQMHDSEVKAFIALEQQLPSFGGQVDGDLKRYVSALRFIMRGHLDWALESGRY